jgi:hypothetical protein
MKKISKLIVAALILLGLTISACDKRSDVTRDSLSFEGINTEEVLSSEDTKELSKLLGNLTFGQVLDLLGNSLKTLDALGKQGYTTREDYQTLLNIIKNTYTYMLEEKAAYEADPEAYDEAHPESASSISSLFKMAVDAKVGVLLNQVIKQAGSQCITQNIYPMIAYVLNADDDILKNAISGGSNNAEINKIERAEFDKLIELVNKLVDKDGEYKALHDSLSIFRTKLDTEPNSVTVDDVKALLKDLDTLSGPYGTSETEETVPGPYTDEQSKQIWDKAAQVLKNTLKNDDAVRDDLKDFSKALSIYMTSNDFKSTLDGLTYTLATDPVILKNFVANALVGLASSSGSDSMSNMAPYLANINVNDIDGIAKGLTSILWTDWYYKSGPNARPDVKTSGLRALMYMMQESGNTNNVLNRFQIINLMSSPDDTTYKWIPSNWYTNNVAEWTIGEVVRAVDKFGPTKGIDYVLYKKPYKLAAFTLFGISFSAKDYKGMNAMMSDSMMDMFREESTLMKLVQLFDGSIEGVDGILDPFPAFKELAGGDGKTDGTAGTRHKLICLFAPLMKSAWQADVDDFLGKNNMPKTRATVDMMAKLNEINHESYHPLKSSSPTFVKDDQGSVIKKAEPALLMALMDRSTPGQTDPGLVAPILKVAITIAKRLNETDCPVVNKQKLLVSIIKDLNMQPMTVADQNEMIAKLFSDKNEQNQKTLIENVNLFLTNINTKTGKTNTNNIVEFARVMGTAMNTSNIGGNLVDIIPDLIADYDDVSSIISKFIPESTDTGDDSTSSELMDYLTAKINEGKDDNPFIANSKTLLYKALDVQDDIYNPAGFIKGSTPVTGPDSLLKHLSDLYLVTNWYGGDIEPITTFLTEATGTEEGQEALWSVLDQFYNKNDSKEVGMLTKIMGGEGAGENYIKISIEPKFIRALFTPVDNNGDGIKEDAVAFALFKQVKLSYVDTDKEFMQRILGELYDLTQGSSGPSILSPKSEGYNNLVLTLKNLLDNITVK